MIWRVKPKEAQVSAMSTLCLPAIVFTVMAVAGTSTTTYEVSNGRITLAGNELLPPFRINIRNGVFVINGFRQPGPSQAKPASVGSHHIAQALLHKTLYDTVATLRGRGIAEETVMEHARRFMGSSALVDSVRASDSKTLQVWWSGAEYFEEFSLGSRGTVSHEQDSVAEGLQGLAYEVAQSLGRKCWVIIDGSEVVTIPAARTGEVQREIEGIRRGQPPPIGRAFLPKRMHRHLLDPPRLIKVSEGGR